MFFCFFGKKGLTLPLNTVKIMDIERIMTKKILVLFTSVIVSVTLLAAQRHPLVIISLDGCRWDYPLWYDMPFLDYMAEEGASSGLIPSFPSKTFPNHYTLATGLYPDHHGIVANSFLDTQTGGTFSLGDSLQKHDARYYGGEPLWLTAKRHGLKAAVFYWPGSDVAIGGEYPEVYYDYDATPRLTNQQRLDGIIQELKKPDSKRPDLIMAYMEEPDASGHDNGPQSRDTRMAAAMVDRQLSSLYLQLLSLPIGRLVNFIIVSDHGMTWVDPSRRIDITPYLKPEWVLDSQGSIPENIYTRSRQDTDSVYEALHNLPHVRVWRKEEIPEYLHYGTNSRIGDVIVLPDLGYIVYNKPFKTGGGQHGYDPTLNDMHAVFRAIGPDISHVELPHFPNVDLYPLACRLLRLTPAPNDGDLKEVEALLR